MPYCLKGGLLCAESLHGLSFLVHFFWGILPWSPPPPLWSLIKWQTFEILDELSIRVNFSLGNFLSCCFAATCSVTWRHSYHILWSAADLLLPVSQTGPCIPLKTSATFEDFNPHKRVDGKEKFISSLNFSLLSLYFWWWSITKLSLRLLWNVHKSRGSFCWAEESCQPTYHVAPKWSSG